MKQTRSAAGFPATRPAHVVEPRLRIGCVHMRSAAVPPRTVSVGGRLPRTWLAKPTTHQVRRPPVIALPLPPQQRPQFVPDPAIEFFQHTFHFGEPEICNPAS